MKKEALKKAEIIVKCLEWHHQDLCHTSADRNDFIYCYNLAKQIVEILKEEEE